MRKLQRKQQEDAEREQRRQEKEEAELKKKLSIKKQASIMERFVKRSKTIAACQNDQFLTKAIVSESLGKSSKSMPDVVTQSMDHTLSSNMVISAEDIRRLVLSIFKPYNNKDVLVSK